MYDRGEKKCPNYGDPLHTKFHIFKHFVEATDTQQRAHLS